MPALMPTAYHATVRWLGLVPEDPDGIASVPADMLVFGFEGPLGDSHVGLTRPSCSRVTAQHAKGTEIANARQVSIIAAEDLALIAATMGLDVVDPTWCGATLVLEGIPDFTHVPPSSRLQGPDGVTLVVDMENRPCHLPAREIEAIHPGIGKAFKSAAQNRRGVTAWVERPGTLRIGDVMRLHVPDQPVWSYLEQARHRGETQ